MVCLCEARLCRPSQPCLITDGYDLSWTSSGRSKWRGRRLYLSTFSPKSKLSQLSRASWAHMGFDGSCGIGALLTGGLINSGALGWHWGVAEMFPGCFANFGQVFRESGALGISVIWAAIFVGYVQIHSWGWYCAKTRRAHVVCSHLSNWFVRSALGIYKLVLVW